MKAEPTARGHDSGRAVLAGRRMRAVASPLRAVAVIVAITGALSLVAGCGPAARSQTGRSQTGRQMKISACGAALQSQPGVFTVVCTNNSVAARDLHWSGWGGPVATASGSAVVDLCAFEDCAAGNYVTVPIVIIASKVMKCPGAVPAYGRLQYVFVGTSPFAGLPAKASVPDGSETPANPADQTVALPC
jgi:hypothetical protein